MNNCFQTNNKRLFNGFSTKAFKSIYIIFIFPFVLIWGCEANSDTVTPKAHPRLVIHSYISPSDTILLVHVTSTQNIYGKIQDKTGKLPVKVMMMDGESLIEFSQSDSMGICKAKYQIQPGHEYKIKVTCEGYPDVNASCHVPDLSSGFSISIDTSTWKDPDMPNTTVKIFTISYKDLPGEQNFYGLSAFMIGYNENAEDIKHICSPNLKGGDINSNNSLVYADQDKDGEQFIREFRSFYAFDSEIYSDHYTYVVCNLLEIDKDFYRYVKSLVTCKGTDDPFTEYLPPYSNVSGGYGIFASYVSYKKILKLK